MNDLATAIGVSRPSPRNNVSGLELRSVTI